MPGNDRGKPTTERKQEHSNQCHCLGEYQTLVSARNHQKINSNAKKLFGSPEKNQSLNAHLDNQNN